MLQVVCFSFGFEALLEVEHDVAYWLEGIPRLRAQSEVEEVVDAEGEQKGGDKPHANDEQAFDVLRMILRLHTLEVHREVVDRKKSAQVVDEDCQRED